MKNFLLRFSITVMFVFMLVLLFKNQTLKVEAAEETKKVAIGTTVTGSHKDFEMNSIEFEIDKPGMVTISFSTKTDITSGDFGYYFIIGSDGKYYEWYEKGTSGSTGWNSLGGVFSYDFVQYLEKGTYTYNFRCSGNGEYKISSKNEVLKESFPESNMDSDNTALKANSIKLGETYYGVVGLKDEDVYKFVVPESGMVDVSVTTESQVNYMIVIV